MMLPAPLLVLLFAVVACAAYTDAKVRRIPNWLTGFGLLAAFFAQTSLRGWDGFCDAAKGMLAGFAVYFVLYLIRALGAGDVKLMAVVGAFTGTSIWFEIFVATALAGAAAACILALAKGRLITTFQNTWFIANELLNLRLPYQTNKALDVRNRSSLTLPHGISIAFGVALVAMLSWGNWIG